MSTSPASRPAGLNQPSLTDASGARRESPSASAVHGGIVRGPALRRGVAPLAAVAAALAGLVVAVMLAISFLSANPAIGRFLVALVAILALTLPTAFIVGYVELKTIAFMNLRIGPQRVGPFGTLIPVFHGLKMLGKEDISPTHADRTLYTLAPVITFLPAVMTLLVIPFGPGLFGIDLNVGVLFVLSIGGLTALGILLGGWASYNKYALIGGLRSAAQMVGYEVPLALSLGGLILLAGTMSLNGIVLEQSGSVLDWFIVRQPLAFIVFFIAATAEANRTPFDLMEADQEIVAGAVTEYTGMRFGFFYFAEFLNVFVVAALTTTLFLGGWNAPLDWPWPVGSGSGAGGSGLPDLEWLLGLAWFFAKTYLVVFTFSWMRVTFPRIRVDQLMGFAWKWLVPASLLNLFAVAAAILVAPSTR